MGLFAHHQRLIESDERIRRTATATDDIHESLIHEFRHLRCHRLCCFVIEPQGVRQSGIRVATDIIRCLPSQFAQIGFHLRGAKRAVQADGEYWISTHAGEESIQGLSGECSSCQITDGDGEHDGQRRAPLLHHPHRSVDTALGVQRVEDSLNQQGIHPTLYERIHLLHIGVEQLVVGQFTSRRITHIRRHREGLVCRSDGACHKTRLFVCRKSIRLPAGNPGPFKRHLPGCIL